MKTNIFVDLPQEEAFKTVLDHIQEKKYLLLLRKQGYDVRKVLFPSRIQVRLGASWGARGKVDIEVTPSDGGSLVEIGFELVGGKVELVGSILLLFLGGLVYTFLLPIVAAGTLPIFLTVFDVYTAKDKLISELKQLFRNLPPR